MAKRTVILEMTVSYKYRITFDDDSDEFKEAKESYLQVIDKEGDETGMLSHCVFNYGLRGDKDVEGVGRVKIEGAYSAGQEDDFPDSGIVLNPEWEEYCDFEVNEIRTCHVCGCTEDRGCEIEGGCHWVGDNLCSNPECVAKAGGEPGKEVTP